MSLTVIATARQPKKNLLQNKKTISIHFSHRKSISINTKHAVNVFVEHNRDESVFMEHTDASPQITDRRRRVRTLTSCVSAQASWPENCPCAKRKRVRQRLFLKIAAKTEKWEITKQKAYTLQRSEFSPSRSTTRISFHSQFEQINNTNQEICKTFFFQCATLKGWK